jgi:hypothetical protein
MENNDFLNKLYKLHEKNHDLPTEKADKKELQDATDLIFDHIDEYLADKRYDDVQELLNTIDLNKIAAVSMISLLTITFSAKPVLTNRAAFYGKVIERMNQLNRAEETLGQFENSIQVAQKRR